MRQIKLNISFKKASPSKEIAEKFASLMFFKKGGSIMAIYHFSGQMISRGKGQSVTAAAAYRSGEKLHSERYNKTNEYKRLVQPESFILTPKNAPNWANNRERLWNEVEKTEKQKNSQLCREVNIALPIELSNKEQNELAKRFCQEALVDEGMVADVSIHRDDVNNPHFHVMLTLREFKPNGEWDAKASKMKLENGKEKRINKNNWGDRDTFNKWRKEWADYANESLERNGFDQRISHLSHKKLNKQEMPTIHEGQTARKMGDRSDRISINKEIKTFNKKVQNLNEFKQEKQQVEKTKSIARSFSPAEKKEISEAAKSLKMFVTFRNINEKEKMLERWHYSTIAKIDEPDKKEKTLQNITGIKEKLHAMDNILTKEANRFLNKHYPSLGIEEYSDFSKKYMVDLAVSENTIFDVDQAKGILYEGEQEEVNHELSKLIQNRHYSYKSIAEQNGSLTNKFDQLVRVNRVDFNNPETFERLEVGLQNDIEKTFKMKQATGHALTFLEKHYEDQLEKLYGNAIGKHMTINEKELAVGFSEYFKKPVSLTGDQDQVDLFQFTTDEKEQIIDLLHDYQNERKTSTPYTETRFADILSGSASIQHFFIAECIDTKDLSTRTQAKLEDILSAYEEEHEKYISFNNTRPINSLSKMVQLAENTIKQADYAEREKVQEMRRLQNQQSHKGLGR